MAVQTNRNKNAAGASWDGKDGSAVEFSALSELFHTPSMSSDNRQLPEVDEVIEILKKGYTAMAESTIQPAQRAIIPTVDKVSPVISSTLPGLVMHRIVGQSVWVMLVLFSNKDNAIATETVQVLQPMGMPHKTSVLLTPTNYFTNELVDNLKKHFKQLLEVQGLKGDVEIINLMTEDLEMLNHSQAGELKERPQRISNYLKGEWETAVFCKLSAEYPKHKQQLPSPFKDPDAPYGKDGWAEARVSAIDNKVSKAGTLMPSNMELVISTTSNPNSNNNNQNQANSKGIVRALATVQLSAISYQMHMQNIAAISQAGGQADAIQAFLGINGGMYMNGYRPLHPVITLDHANAEEMMNYNNGLFPHYYALFALMCTNTDYIFTEPLRRANVGARGNLSSFEPRIEGLIAQIYTGARPQMDDKTILDTEAVNKWIHQNISPNALFRSNVILGGLSSPVNKHLEVLSDPVLANRQAAVQAMIAVLDAMSKGRFSQLVAENVKSGKGWKPGDVALHRTKMIAVNGLAKNPQGRELNTLEVDEMYLGTHKGKAGQQQSMNYLGVLYGTNNEEVRSRCQKLRIEMTTGLFDGHVHINNFGYSCVWDPHLMAVIGAALSEIGTLNVANTYSSMRPNNMAFMPMAGLQTVTSVGNSNNMNILGGFGNGGIWG